MDFLSWRKLFFWISVEATFHSFQCSEVFLSLFLTYFLAFSILPIAIFFYHSFVISKSNIFFHFHKRLSIIISFFFFSLSLLMKQNKKMYEKVSTPSDQTVFLENWVCFDRAACIYIPWSFAGKAIAITNRHTDRDLNRDVKKKYKSKKECNLASFHFT